MNTIQLTPAQHDILAYAIEHTGGRIEWFPEKVKGGARKKVLDGLFNLALITTDGTDWFVTAEGYDALGRDRPNPFLLYPDPKAESAEATAEAKKVRGPRQNSKQAAVIQMLQRAEGATIDQICAATGWRAHTVRGTLSGTLKKKMGLNVTSEKTQDGVRVYRIE